MKGLSGLWKVLEYEHPSSRIVKVWQFRDYNEANEFREKREEFYRITGLDQSRALSEVLPEIAPEEIELFAKIIENPHLLRHVMRTFEIE